jgi:hypothetical protein
MRRKVGRQLASCIVAIAAVGAIIGSTAPTASACRLSPAENEHCYGTAQFYVPGYAFAGDTTTITTSYAAIQEWKENFFTNEEWACSSGYECHYWVEGGAIIGRGKDSYRYFVAYKKPSTGFIFYEYPNGPGSSPFGMDIHAFPGGTLWYLTVAGEPTYGVGETLPYADTLIAGLEETENNPINWGTASPLYWWNPNNGEHHESWQGYGDVATIHAVRPACAEFPSGGYNEVYWVANNCSFGPLAQAQIAQTPAPEPGEGYTAPTGSEMSESQLDSVAMKIASEARESAPTDVTVVHTDRRDAMAALDESSTIPSASQASALAPWLSGAVDLITMHGHFGPSVPKPQGSPTVTGTVLTAVVDARTGELTGFRVGEQGPSSEAIAALGGSEALN